MSGGRRNAGQRPAALSAPSPRGRAWGVLGTECTPERGASGTALDRRSCRGMRPRLEGVSKRMQYGWAVCEYGEDLLFLVRREHEFVPVRVESEPDVVCQSLVPGTLKATGEHRHRGCRYDHSGDDHPVRLIPRLPSRKRPAVRKLACICHHLSVAAGLREAAIRPGAPLSSPSPEGSALRGAFSISPGSDARFSGTWRGRGARVDAICRASASPDRTS